jgi:hypothetical protein
MKVLKITLTFTPYDIHAISGVSVMEREPEERIELIRKREKEFKTLILKQ